MTSNGSATTPPKAPPPWPPSPSPVISPAGTRTAGMPITSPRVQALLAALCVFRLLPDGFTNRDLRTHLAPLLGLTPEAMTSGQITYDLRRLRIHGLIYRIPHSFRYQVTPAGTPPGPLPHPAHPAVPDPRPSRTHRPQPASPLPAARSCPRLRRRLDDLARQAGLAA